MAQMGREWVWLHPRSREPHSPLLPLAMPPTSSRHSGIPTALTRGMRSNAQGWAWHHLMSKLLQAASFFFFFNLSPVSFLAGCVCGEKDRERSNIAGEPTDLVLQ